MKYRILPILLLAIVAVCISPSFVQAADAPAKTRILLTFGGHGFEEKPFFAMFDAMKSIEYTKAPMPQSADLLKPGLEKEYDAIVMYDMTGGFTPKQQENFIALLKTGIGVVSLHHNLGAHPNWDEYGKIIGGKYVFKPSQLEGKKYTTSTYSHDEDLKVTIADTDHPITRGLKAFEIHDETYGGYFTSDKVYVLLKTDHPKNDPELAWVHKYGRSRVFFLMLGHDAKAWANPAFPELVVRGIRWTVAD